MKTSQILFLLILLYPLAELLFLMKVVIEFGFLTTFLLVGSTMLLGTFVLKVQTPRLFIQLQQAAQQQTDTVSILLNYFILSICGIILVIPGLLLDGFAILGLIPWLRQRLVAWLARKAGIVNLASATVSRRHHTFDHDMHSETSYSRPHHAPPAEEPQKHIPTVIEGEYKRD